MIKKYKWSKQKDGNGDVIVCEVDGKTPIEEFKNYAKMVVEMTEQGWKPEGWTYKEELKF